MGYSKLTNSVVLANSSNYSQGRNGESICKITPHHMSGVLSGEQCAYIFQDAGRNASANYCIGVDGDIVCSVEEENRAWTSSSGWNDRKAITIEVSNCEIGGDWAISDASWNSLVNLCVDICQRYGFRLDYTGDQYGSLTRHNMYANTDCPGPYLQSRFSELANTVNAILDGEEPQPTPPQPSYPLLRKGSSGDSVRMAQNKLIEKGYSLPNYGADGYFGNETERAVRQLQSDAGIGVDGIVGNQTWGVLNSDFKKPESSYPGYLIMKGSNGDDVRKVQQKLQSLGYDCGWSGEDGIFGNDTEKAVKSFQRNNGLASDGIVGELTWNKLFN